MSNQSIGQTVTQPTASARENFYILRMQPYLFMQLTIQRLLCRLAFIDAALRELPGVLPTNSAGPKHLPQIIYQNNAHVRAETIVVDHGNHPYKYFCCG